MFAAWWGRGGCWGERVGMGHGAEARGAWLWHGGVEVRHCWAHQAVACAPSGCSMGPIRLSHGSHKAVAWAPSGCILGPIRL